ncbi:MAG: type II toxin-antitoxin system VapB family antitoxin [Kiritimatiellales bacterium]
MTTTVQISENLIKQAKKQTGNKTEKGAVEKAITQYLKYEKIRQEFTSLKHSVDMK